MIGSACLEIEKLLDDISLMNTFCDEVFAPLPLDWIEVAENCGCK
jgi:hypothetical protein